MKETIKAKAKEIYHNFLTCQPDMYLAKQCALIHVNGIIEALNNIRTDFPVSIQIQVFEWIKVREEIEQKKI